MRLSHSYSFTLHLALNAWMHQWSQKYCYRDLNWSQWSQRYCYRDLGHQWSQKYCYRDLSSLYGYYPNALKTWLIVKPAYLSDAQRLFEGTAVQVTVEGKHHLGLLLALVYLLSSMFLRRWIHGHVVLLS